jgi:Tfp pilus assembly protein PilN
MTALAFALRYWREIAIAVLVIMAIVAGLYIRSVFAERDRLQQTNAQLTFQVKEAAAMQEMTNQITEAVGQIKARSQINASRIESEPKPVFVDSHPLRFIPGGVLQAVYSSAAAGGGSPSNAPGRAVPTGQPAGRILSR